MTTISRNVLLFASTLLSGCGTMANLEDQRRIYGGLRENTSIGIEFWSRHLTRPKVPTMCLPWVPFAGAVYAVIDFPFTLIGDTLTLPWTIAAELKRMDTPTGPPSEEWKQFWDNQPDADSAHRDAPAPVKQAPGG